MDPTNLLIGATAAYRPNKGWGHYPAVILSLPTADTALIRHPNSLPHTVALTVLSFPDRPRTLRAWAEYALPNSEAIAGSLCGTLPAGADPIRALTAHARKSPEAAVAVRAALLEHLGGLHSYESAWLDDILDIPPTFSLPPITSWAPAPPFGVPFTHERSWHGKAYDPITVDLPHDVVIQRVFYTGPALHPACLRMRGSRARAFAITEDIPVWAGDTLTFRLAERNTSVNQSLHLVLSGITLT